MPDVLHRLALGSLLIAALHAVPAAAQQREAEAATLADAQRRLRQANENLDRAQRDVTRAQRSLRDAQEALDEARREVERRVARVEEATSALTDADGKVVEAQRQRDAARGVIEKLYEGQQR